MFLRLFPKIGFWNHFHWFAARRWFKIFQGFSGFCHLLFLRQCSPQPRMAATTRGRIRWPRKSFSFKKALRYSSNDNGVSFSVSINDFIVMSVPSSRRWKYPVVRLLMKQEAIRILSWIPFFLARTGIVKIIILLPNTVNRMAQTFFRLPQLLIKQMLHALLYIFLWRTPTTLSTHI